MNYEFYHDAIQRVVTEATKGAKPSALAESATATGVEIAALFLSNLHRSADALERIAHVLENPLRKVGG